jgi:hypothetical protein
VGVAAEIVNRVPARIMVPAIAWQYRLFEPELGRLTEFVPKDRGAVDVGVWWGPWSWWLARRVPRVDSFEPNPAVLARLGPVMPDNVTIHPVALSNCTGRCDHRGTRLSRATNARGCRLDPTVCGDPSTG